MELLKGGKAVNCGGSEGSMDLEREKQRMRKEGDEILVFFFSFLENILFFSVSFFNFNEIKLLWEGRDKKRLKVGERCKWRKVGGETRVREWLKSDRWKCPLVLFYDTDRCRGALCNIKIEFCVSLNSFLFCNYWTVLNKI